MVSVIPGHWRWGSPGKAPSESVPSSRSLLWVPTCPAAPVLLQAYGDEPATGWWLLGWAWEELGQGGSWASPFATVPLCSFVHTQTSFLSCNLLVISYQVSSKQFLTNSLETNYFCQGLENIVNKFTPFSLHVGLGQSWVGLNICITEALQPQFTLTLKGDGGHSKQVLARCRWPLGDIFMCCPGHASVLPADVVVCSCE